MTVDEIANSLRESEEFREAIGRDAGMFTIALFAESGPAEDQLQLVGTGTLLAVGDHHYVLTAAHVWEEGLKSSSKMGITLKEDVRHEFSMSIDTIVPCGIQRPDEWNEWGPDLVLLRIPPAHVGKINASRVFYRFPEETPVSIISNHVEVVALMGTPYDLGTYDQSFADITINAFFMGIDAPYKAKGNFDYLDFEMDLSHPGTLNNFGGVSGGGLWRFQIYANPVSGEVESRVTLEGVAFYQSDIIGAKRIIRCHGPKSIQFAIDSLKQ